MRSRRARRTNEGLEKTHRRSSMDCEHGIVARVGSNCAQRAIEFRH